MGGGGGGESLCVQGAFGSKHKLVLEGHVFSIAVIGGLPGVTRILCVQEPSPAGQCVLVPRRTHRRKIANRGPFTLKHLCFCRKANDNTVLVAWEDCFSSPFAEMKSGEIPQLF